jgi:SAM-dependent methyltransferase
MASHEPPAEIRVSAADGSFPGTRPRSFRSAAKSLLRRVLPRPVINFGKSLRGSNRHPRPPGYVRFGDLRRLEPLSRCYGFDRGRPIDRYYIEKFLESQSACIRGAVLEIGENTYTLRYGKDVKTSDVLHVTEGTEGATYIDDLTDGTTLPSNAFDCVIVTQTLHLIYDMKAALQTLYRILKPGGVLLCTVPGITQISDEEWNDTWYWSLSASAARRLFKDVFPPDAVSVEAFGNVLSAMAFLQGMADSELTHEELDFFDPEYPVTVAIRARTAHRELRTSMDGRWNYAGSGQFAYDEVTSYRKGIEFLDGHGRIEDWGCGTAFARRFVRISEYLGIDGSPSEFVDVVADLQVYRSTADCIYMRHVLEHNWGWRAILANAMASFGNRMVLVVFTPFGESEMKLLDTGGVPDLALHKEELVSFFQGCLVSEETLVSQTQYGSETLFYLQKQPDDPATS